MAMSWPLARAIVRSLRPSLAWALALVQLQAAWERSCCVRWNLRDGSFMLVCPVDFPPKCHVSSQFSRRQLQFWMILDCFSAFFPMFRHIHMACAGCKLRLVFPTSFGTCIGALI